MSLYKAEGVREKMNVDVDLKKCVACAACSVACMDQNDTDIPGGEKPLRIIGSLELEKTDKSHLFLWFSKACMHCEHCVPMEKCPGKCFHREPDTGLVILDPSNCVGCALCVRVCTFEAITAFDKDKKMHKCNGCVERVRAGREPACVRSCPKGAILFSETETLPEDLSLKNHPELLSLKQGEEEEE